MSLTANIASYSGKITVTLGNSEIGFAQRIGGGKYALHEIAALANAENSSIDGCYKNGQAVAVQSKGRVGVGEQYRAFPSSSKPSTSVA
ncbi:hypothetical protein GALL_463570 [mine drainage metagenome]|uniref:Uncharacterized protein n=1 Tax=mine drainage metagenome TaxID=410659 RepID=A0A1J5PW42_9ZZZZ